VYKVRAECSPVDKRRTRSELLQRLADAEERLAQRENCAQRLEHLEKENRILRQKIDALIRRLYGASSERLDPAQLLLILQGEQEPKKAEGPGAGEAEPRRPDKVSFNKERQPRLPEHLPVEEQIIDPEAVKACPEKWRCIGEEVSEQLDYEPARFWRRRLVRRKYVRRDELMAFNVCSYIQLFYRVRTRWDIALAPFPPSLILSR
jgi:transposase